MLKRKVELPLGFQLRTSRIKLNCLIRKYNSSNRAIKLVFLVLALSILFFSVLSFEVIAKSTRQITATPVSFSTHVIEVAREEFPKLDIEQTESPFVLKVNKDGRISLDNLYKRVRPLKSRRLIKNEIINFLGVMANMPPEVNFWDDVKSRILPQIFPKEYLKEKNMKDNLVYKPLNFSDDLLEGYVIDSERAFQYINKKHLAKWSKDKEAVREAAYDNLALLTKNTRLKAKFPKGRRAEGKFLTIQVSDGFAAARLLLPQVRAQIENKLGKPCFVAIPNRDLLIAWSYDFSQKKKFQRNVIRQFHFKDHPLSPKVYAIVNSKIEKKKLIDDDTTDDTASKSE